MSKRSSLVVLFSVVMVAAMLLGACQPAPAPAPAQPQTIIQTVEVEKVVQSTVIVQATAEPTKENVAAKFKLATILPGVITDADFNTLGYIATTTVQKDLGIEVAYSESVPVPDADRVMREYLDQGFNILYIHGNQFNAAAIALAKAFPDVVFIGHTDIPVDNAPANMWFIDRNFNVPYYVIGYIAGKLTKSGKIGYLSGLDLPFSYQEYHAIEQSLADNKITLNAPIKAVWTGDFNDPTKARQVTDQMIAEGIDVIMGSQNLGMFGIFEGAKAASTKDKTILVTAKYTDKTAFAPKNYVTAALYDFATPLKDIVTKIMAGTKGGYYPIMFGTGSKIQVPLKNVSADLQPSVDQMIKDIQSGKIVVKKDATKLSK